MILSEFRFSLCLGTFIWSIHGYLQRHVYCTQSARGSIETTILSIPNYNRFWTGDDQYRCWRGQYLLNSLMNYSSYVFLVPKCTTYRMLLSLHAMHSSPNSNTRTVNNLSWWWWCAFSSSQADGLISSTNGQNQRGIRRSCSNIASMHAIAHQLFPWSLDDEGKNRPMACVWSRCTHE